MFFLKKALTALALPPFSLIVLALLGLWLSRRHPRTGRWLSGLSLLVMALLSLPLVSGALMRSLEHYPPVKAQQLSRTQAIIILGGGVYYGAPEYGRDTVNRHSLERLRYGVQLQKQTGLPILVSGGAPYGGRPEAEAMKEVIERELGGKVRWTETRSFDTAENASLSAATLWAAGISRVALVSHASHLHRAVPLFERRGLEVVAAPTGFTTAPEQLMPSFIPKAQALAESSTALHEWLGILVEKYWR